ncbi:MAG: hypothetical protein IIC85_01975 [Chloroflexi bacterium]|nr:hypothetical protein [Chloroflexota bacterium]
MTISLFPLDSDSNDLALTQLRWAHKEFSEHLLENGQIDSSSSSHGTDLRQDPIALHHHAEWSRAGKSSELSAKDAASLRGGDVAVSQTFMAQQYAPGFF